MLPSPGWYTSTRGEAGAAATPPRKSSSTAPSQSSSVALQSSVAGVTSPAQRPQAAETHDWCQGRQMPTPEVPAAPE